MLSGQSMLLEREAAIAKFNRCILQISQSGKILLLSGEAGIGKTSLLEHIRLVADTNIDILWSGCEPLFTPRPYAPIYDFALSKSSELLKQLENMASSNVIFTSFFSTLEALKKPTLLIIEDLHWADHATLDLLKYVVRRISFLPCMLCLSYRDDEMTPEHPFNSVLTLMPSAHTHRVQLLPLSIDAVAKLAKSSTYEPKRLHSITGGNPFFVAELLTSGMGDNSAIPVSIKEAVSSRVKHLERSERELLHTLCLIPRSIPVSLIRCLFGENGETCAMACVARRLLHCDQHTVFKFRHELVRLAILGSQAAYSSKVIHTRILACLESLKLTKDLAWLTHHAEGALDVERVLKYAPHAARQAATQGAHKEAASFYGIALKYVEYAPADMAASIYECWAYEVSLTTHMDTSVIDARRHAISLWRALGRPEKVGENLRCLARLYWYQGQADVAEEYAKQAISTFDAIHPSCELAMAYSMRSQLKMLNDEMQEAVKWGHKALKLARQFSSAQVEAHALNNIGTALVMSGDEGGEKMLSQSLSVAEQHGLHEDVARVYTNYSDYCIRFKKLDMAEFLTAKGIQYDIAHDLDSWTYYLVGLQAQLRQEQGRLIDARTIAGGVQKLKNQTLLMKLPALLVLARAHSRLAQSDSYELLQQALHNALSTNEQQYIIPARLALIEHGWLYSDNIQRCKDAIEHIERLGSLSPPVLNVWQLGELRVWQRRFAVDKQDDQVVAKPYQLELDGEYTAASQAWQNLGMPFNAGMSLLHDGQTFCQDRVLRAWEMFDNMQAKAVLGWIRRKAQKEGWGNLLPRPRRGPYQKSRQHPLGLTSKEQQVLKLLVTGVSNQKIAEALSRSVRTVENHISSILAKLNVTNRVEAMLRVQNEPWLSD